MSDPTQISEPLDFVVVDTASMTDDTVITRTLTLASANDIRALTNLATDRADTFLKVESTAFKDFNDNSVVPVVKKVNQALDGFIADTTAPLATGFAIDLDAGTLTVSYQQPVKGSSVDPVAFTLENKITSADSTQLLDGDVMDPDNVSTSFVLTFTKSVLDEIKRKDVCAKATGEGGCFLRFGASSVDDATGQTIAGIDANPTTQAALTCTAYTADGSPPTLVDNGFVKLDLNNAEITFSFSETIKRDSVDYDKIHLQAAALDISKEIYANVQSLDFGSSSFVTIVSTQDGTELVYKVSAGDINLIQQLGNLCGETYNCVLKMDKGAFLDMAGNDIAANALSTSIVQTLTKDTTGPVLDSFGLDMNNAWLYLTFDETVDYRELKVQHITLQNSSIGGSSKSLTVHPGSVVTTDNGLVMKVKISVEDMNYIKGEEFCSSEEDTYISMAALTVLDMSKNPFQTISPDGAQKIRASRTVITQTSGPAAAGSRILSLVNTDGIEINDEVTISDGNNSQTSSVTKVTADSGTVTIANPLVFGYPLNTTVIFSKPGGFKADTSPPTIGDFGIDLERGELTVTFSEPVEPGTANASAMTIQNTKLNPTHVRKIDRATTPLETGPSKVLTFQLSDGDMAVIKANANLGTSKDDLFLVAAVGVGRDTAGIPSSAILAADAIRADSHVSDTTLGSLQEFSVNFEARTLTLSFNENIRAQSFDAEQLSFQSEHDLTDTEKTYVLTETSKVVEGTGNGEKIVINLSDPDILGIGNVAGLAIDAATTYLAIGVSVFEDTLGRYVIAEPKDKAKQVKLSGYTPDSTPPQISKSSLDMTAGTLSLSFTEAIDATTFNISDIAIKNAAGDRKQLTGGTVKIAVDAQSAIITLDNDDDLNFLKEKRALAVDEASSIIEHSSALMADVFEVDTVGTDVSMLDGDFEADGKPPTLKTFSFNVDTATLVLTFDEPIESDSVKPNMITLQATADGSGEVLGSYKLDGFANKSTTDGTEITIVLVGTDIDTIKERPLARTTQNTWMSLFIDTVKDMNDNGIVAVATEAAINVDPLGFVGDTSPPTLDEFELNLQAGTLTFVCSETIETTSVDPTAFRFQKAKIVNIDTSTQVHNSTQYQSYKLVHTPKSSVSTTDDTTITITLDVKDLNALKQQLGVAGTKETTFLSYTGDAASDMSTNQVTPRAPYDGLPVKSPNGYVADITPPTLDDFSLNLDTGTLSFTFSEPVAAPDKFDMAQVVLQSAEDSANLNPELDTYQLNDLVSKTMDYTTVINVKLTDNDLNGIKLASQLATSASATFIAIGSTLCADVYGNPVTPVTVDAAEGMDDAEYTGDSVGPTMSKATLNMHSRSLTLEFDEAVNVANINVPGISIRTNDDLHFVLLTKESSSVVTTSNGLTVIISIGVDDANRIKANPDLAQVESETYVMIAASTIADMVPNACIKQRRSVFKLIPDGQKPTLTSFSINMNKEQLSLTFDETVDADTLTNASKISIRSQKADLGVEFVTLSGGNVDTTAADYRYSTVVLFQMLSSPDLDSIKKKTNLAKNGDTTFIRLADGTISDTSANLIDVVISEKCGDEKYVVDSKKPTLVSFDLDMHGMKLRLTFSETVLASSLKPNKITIQHAATVTNSLMVRTLTSGAESTSSLDSTTLVISLNAADSNAIKKATGLGTKDGSTSLADGDDGVLSDTYITFKAGTVTDMALPTAIGIDALTIGKPATVVTFDAVAPTLVGQSLNMHDGILTLTFSETVKAASLKPKFFTIHGSKTGDGPFRKLTGHKAKSTLDGTELTITLNDKDMNIMKEDLLLATSKPTTVVSADAGGVQDMVATTAGDFNLLSELTVADGFDANVFQQDLKSPTLLEYKLDMDNKLVQFTFSETMEASSLKGGQVTFYDDITNGAHFMRLTGGTAKVFGNATALSGTKLTLPLTPTDFNELQFREDLATSATNTYMALSSTAVDMNGNPVNNITSALAQKAKDFFDDNVAATLDHFDLDLTAETLTLVFSETMDVTALWKRFDATKIVLQSGSDVSDSGATFHRLQGEIEQPLRVDDTVIVVKLMKKDLEALKFDRNLATGGATTDDGVVTDGNTWISIAHELVNDQSNIAVSAINDGDATQVKAFKGDETKPILESFTLDMADGKVVLSFTETMAGADVLLESMQIQNTNGVSAIASEFVTLNGSTYVAVDALTVEFTVSTTKLNDLKRFRNLATSTSNTFIKLSAGAAKDMAGNAIVEQVLVAESIEPDDIRPKVLSFVASMVTGSESITITFDETVNVKDNLLTEHIYLFGGADPNINIPYGFQAASSSSADGTVVRIDIETTDVDIFKQKDICTKKSKCYLGLNKEAITDMAGLTVEPVVAEPAGTLDNDITEPTIVEFAEFDYDENTLTLSFSEPVDPLTMNANAIRLDSAQQMDITDADNANFFYKLLGGTTTSLRGATIVIDVERVDMNAIKQLPSLCVAKFNCYVRVTNSGGAQNDEPFIRDTFGNGIVSVTNADTTRFSTKVQVDTEGAVLENFVLDLQANTLTLTFDEPVSSHEVEAAFITIQNADGTASLKLAGGQKNTTLPQYGTVSEVALLDADVLKIKALTNMATNKSNTYISMTDSVVKDLRQVKNNALPNVGLNLPALIATEYITDDTDPIIEAFEAYDATLGQLRISFNEPVDKNRIDGKKITLYAKGDETGSNFFELSGYETSAYSDDDTKLEVVITLLKVDFENVLISDLASQKSNTYVAIGAGMIKDTSGNGNSPTPTGQALNVEVFGNVQEASLDKFDLNLDAATLTLSFSGVVNSDTFKAKYLTLQNSADGSGGEEFSLTNASTTQSDSGFDIVVNIHKDDLDEIKAFRDLCTGEADTYISMESKVVEDFSDREALSIAANKGIQVNDYKQDVTPPTLDGFEFSLDNGQGKGVIILSFSEVVDITAKLLTAIVVQDAASPTVESVRLTGGTITESDTDTMMTIELKDIDLNAIKHVDGLADSISTTYISIDSSLITDMTPNAITAKIGLNVKSLGFTLDTTRPTVTEFDLNMRLGMLYLTFSETVELASLAATGITFQDHKTSPSIGGSYKLLNAGTKGEVSETKLTLELDDDDMNAIKANAFLTPASTIYMILAEGTVTDPTPNNISAISSSNAVEATLYTKDNVDPQLHATKSFDLNMNAGYIKMHFTEAIKEGSFIPGSLILYSDVSSAVGVVSHPISSKSLVVTNHADNVDSHYTTIRIALHKDDMDAIKNIPLLANNKGNTHISFAANTFTDVDGNPLVGIAATSAKEAGAWVPDSTPPELDSFSLNMNDNTLTLNFNEPVNDINDAYDAITIQSKADLTDVNAPAPTKVTLSGAKSKVRSTDGMVLIIYLRDKDINLKTKDAGLAISDNTSFISMKSAFIVDMAGVNVKPIFYTAAKQTPAGGFTQDTTRPQLQSWDLDMTLARLTLHFLETMDIASLEVDKIKLQAKASVVDTADDTSGDIPTQVQLSNATVVPNSANGLQVAIQLTNDEMNELKRKNIGRNAGTAWLVIQADGIDDMNGKQVVPRINDGNAMSVDAATFVPDGKNPTLTSFALSMSSGLLVLTFSETVNAGSVNVARDFIISSGLANSANFESYNLGTGVTGHTYTTSSNGPTITVQLAIKDLNAIKALDNLATDIGNCHLSIGSTAVDAVLMDMDGNLLITVDTQAVDDTEFKFKQDSVSPSLVDWQLSMDGAGLLTLTFDETMNPVIDMSMVFLQWKSDDGTQFRQLDGGIISNDRSIVVTIIMDILDMNAIKKNQNLAVDASSVFLRIDRGAIRDMNLNPVNAVVATDARPLTTNNFVADSTKPKMIGFTFNMNAFTLSLTFDETIFADSITPSELTFVKDAASHRLGGYDAKSSEDGTVIDIKLNVSDMNALKLDQVLTIDEASTALAFGTAFAKDMTQTNTITAYDASAPLEVDENGFSADSEDCEINGFNLNLNTGQITITFNEAVDASSLGEGLTLQSTAQLQSVSQFVTLQDSKPIDVDGTSITLNIPQSDLNAIAREDNLCTAVGNCYLSVTSVAALDMTGLNSVDASVTHVGSGNIVHDAKPPTLVDWSMDTERGWIKCTFSETIDASTFEPTFVKVDGPGSSGGVTLDDKSAVVDADDTIVQIDIGAASLDLIKQFLAEETATVHIVMKVGAFFDMAPVGNALEAVQKDILELIEDSTKPYLDSWELDMETGTITFHLSEIVKIDSLKTELFTLKGTASNEEFTLTERN